MCLLFYQDFSFLVGVCNIPAFFEIWHFAECFHPKHLFVRASSGYPAVINDLVKMRSTYSCRTNYLPNLERPSRDLSTTDSISKTSSYIADIKRGETVELVLHKRRWKVICKNALHLLNSRYISLYSDKVVAEATLLEKSSTLPYSVQRHSVLRRNFCIQGPHFGCILALNRLH